MAEGSALSLPRAEIAIAGIAQARHDVAVIVQCRIDSQGRLTVGKQARIKGDIKTRSVIVDGTVNGNITAGERCELRAGCSVNGDIEAPRLVVDEAASFVGSAKIATQKQPPAS